MNGQKTYMILIVCALTITLAIVYSKDLDSSYGVSNAQADNPAEASGPQINTVAGNDDTGRQHVIHEAHGPQFLFVISSDSAKFKNNTISLDDVSLQVTYFSDRPYRIAGHMSMDEFVEMWDQGDNSFKKDPPNAALSMNAGKGENTPVIELFDPKLSGKSLTFKTKVIDGEVPGSMKHVSVFIDMFIAARRGPLGGVAVVVRRPFRPIGHTTVVVRRW